MEGQKFERKTKTFNEWITRVFEEVQKSKGLNNDGSLDRHLSRQQN